MTPLEQVKKAINRTEFAGITVVKNAGPRPTLRERLIEKADALRKACASDDIFTALIREDVILFAGQKGTTLLAKATERHPTSGKFVSSSAIGDLFNRADGGAVHPALARLAASRGGKRDPSDTGAPAVSPYDSTPGDPMGNRHPFGSPIE
jgi:hypothetical protein